MDWHITNSFWKCTREAENVTRGTNEGGKSLNQEVPQEVPENKKRRKVENSQTKIKKYNRQEKKPSLLIST